MPVKQINNDKGLLRQEIEDFSGGLNVAVEPSKIKDTEFQILENAILYSLGKLGNATKRYGLERYDAITSTNVIQNIYEYIKQGLNPLLVVKNGARLDYKDGAGSYSNISTTEGTDKVKMLTLNDLLFILNRGTSGSLIQNKVWDRTTYLDSSPLNCPNTFAVALRAGTGLTAEQTYAYLVTYVYADGTETPPMGLELHSGLIYNRFQFGTYGGSSSATSIKTSTAIVGNVSILLTDIPIGNGLVVNRKIYRTKGIVDNPTTFDGYFYLDTLDNKTTSYIDTIPDSHIAVPYAVDNLNHHYMAKRGTVHQSRLFLGNLTLDSTAIDTTVVTKATTAGATIEGDGRAYEIFYKFAYFENLFDFSQFMHPSGYDWALLESKYIYKTSAYTLSDNNNGATGYEFNIHQTIDPYYQQYGIFRTLPDIIMTCSETGGTITFTTNNPFPVKVGEFVNIKGVLNTIGGRFIPDGKYEIITNVTDGTFTVAGTSTGTLQTSPRSGYVNSDRYYFEGTSQAQTIQSVLDNQTFIYTGVYPSSDPNEYSKITNAEDNTVNYSSIVKWSDTNKALTFQLLNEVAIENADNDEITGIHQGQDGLFIWKNRNIYKLITYGQPSQWYYERIIENIGCSDTGNINSLCEMTQGEYIWQMGTKFWHWREGTMPTICSNKIQTIIDGFGAMTNLDVCYNPALNWVIMTFTTGSVTGNILIYDLNLRDEQGHGTWYVFKANQGFLNCVSPITTKAGILLLGMQTAIVQYNKNGIYADVLYYGNTPSYHTGEAIIFSLTTKLFEYIYADIVRFLLKATTSTSGTIVIKITCNSTDNTISYTITAVDTRVNSGFNYQQTKKMQINIAESSTSVFSIKYIGFDYTEVSEEDGFVTS